MRFEILDSGSAGGLAAWAAAWSAWPEREPMAHPGFARLFARPGDRVVAASARFDGATVLFPLILRPLSTEPWARAGETRWDAVTPYGYGGPFAWGAGARDDGAFWTAYSAWCRGEKIVSTFARLSLFPECLAALSEPARELSPNIVVPLDGGPEALWAGYENNARRWFKAAEAAGLSFEADPDARRLDDFFAVYTHTMTRRGAGGGYFFALEFFQKLIAALPGQTVLFHALHEGKVVSSDLVLRSTGHAYNFLSGTLSEAFELGPNYLVKHRGALWLQERGVKSYVLGGGYEPGDGIFRYKKSYARRGGERPFQAACLAHDEAACRELQEARAAFEAARGAAWTPHPRFFPAYRAPAASGGQG